MSWPSFSREVFIWQEAPPPSTLDGEPAILEEFLDLKYLEQGEFDEVTDSLLLAE